MLEFKPLKQKRGSILLIVISMMSVLIMLAQALLLSVSVTQQTQVTNFYDKQAYQTSLSISDIIASDIMKGGAGSIQSDVLNLALNDTLSTGDNGFSAFGGASEQLNKVGAYKVDITFIDDNFVNTMDSEIYKVYEVKVLTNYNGMEETVKSKLYMKETKAEFPGFDRFFTATGYAAGDVVIDKATILNNAFFDNEYTIVVASDVTANITYKNIISGGTFQIESDKFFGEPGDEGSGRDIVIRSDLILKKLPIFHIKSGQMFIGGNIQANQSITFDGATDTTDESDTRGSNIYVLDDVEIDGTLTLQNIAALYVGGSIKGISQFGGKTTNGIFVNGDIWFKGNSVPKAEERVYYSGKIYANGIEQTDSLDSNNYIKVNNAWAKALEIYGDKNIKYIVVNEDNKLKYYKKNDSKVIISTQTIASYIDELTAETVYPSFSPTEGFTHSTPKVGGNAGIVFDSDSYTYYIDAADYRNGAIIDKIKVKEGYTGSNNAKGIVPTIVINNSLPNNEPFAIRLEATTDDGEFSWTGDSGLPANVLIIGTSPVFLEIAEDVKYVANANDFVGHYGWYNIFHEVNNAGDHQVYKNNSNLPTDWSVSQAKNTGDLLNKDQYNNFMYYLDSSNVDTLNTIDVSKFNDYLKSDPLNLDVHNNVFLISIDENADIDMKQESSFFGGFIYAPYMTFKTLGGGGVGIAIAGGMIVSDYVLDDSRGYIFVAPTFDIAKYMQEENPLPSLISRDWKRSLY